MYALRGWFVAVCVFVSAPGVVQAQAQRKLAPSKGAQKAVANRVAAIFEEMRAGTYKDFHFPKLGWRDVPDLLARAGSSRPLGNFPVNALSSQMVEQCSEGMVALWLVEGIRKGCRFASLNALCFADKQKRDVWYQNSEDNHPRALRAYLGWWKRVHALAPEKAAAANPLKGTGLYWY